MYSRKAAFFALLNWHEKGIFLWDSLERWKERENPKKSDLDFAYELACGSMRMQRTLDHIVNMVCKKKPAKLKERIILRLTLYQCYFLPNIPLYAVANSSVQLAKEQCHSSFASFLNALVRKFQKRPLETDDLGIVHSFPDLFVKLLLEQYGREKTISILESSNRPAPLMGCLYGPDFQPSDGLNVHLLDEPHPHFYIQNKTQPKLFSKLASGLHTTPKRILDMCAAPGGKALMLHHTYSGAQLVVNDYAAHKIERLTENLQRFSCKPLILCQKGEELQSDQPFDLILVDAPCSNSGVLYKCPEARWRITEEALSLLADTQRALIANAVRLLAPNGKIWFMTCSILAQENERQIEALCKEFHLQIDGSTYLQLPDTEGYEGGFACQLSLQPGK
ncbi:MAG: methyltransferase domain-containing protein [Verrucomicrobia bacterium]|nr:methyltransferase domain-containing protein [Verrucomicrobiota bacterium]